MGMFGRRNQIVAPQLAPETIDLLRLVAQQQAGYNPVQPTPTPSSNNTDASPGNGGAGYGEIGPGVDGDPVGSPQPNVSLTDNRGASNAPVASGRKGMFGRSLDWLQAPVGNGKFTRADIASLLGATLKDTGAGLQGRDSGAVQAWQGNMADRGMADAMGQDFTVTNPDGTPIDPLARMQQLQLMALRAGARGAHSQAFLSALPGLASGANERNYLSTVPAADQALARMDPGGYARFALGQRTPKSEVIPAGGRLIGFTPDGRTSYDFSAPLKPEPITQDRVLGSVLAKVQQGGVGALSPGEKGIYDRWVNGTDGQGGGTGATPSKVLGQVLDKVRTNGVQSLTSGERDLWNRYNRNPYDPTQWGGEGGGSGGAYDDEGGASAPPPPSAAPRAAGRVPSVSGGNAGALPQSARAALREGQVTTFANGESWTLRGGVPQFVGNRKR